MTTFLLVRHGLTDAVGHVITGTSPGVLLNDTGRAEVAHVTDILRRVPLVAVVASPLERAQATAAPIAASHNLVVQTDPAFNEYEFGGWSNLSLAELAQKAEWQRFNTVRSLTRPPGGELMLEIQQRTMNALLKWRDRYPDGNIAVVSHGDTIRSVLLYCLGMPIDFVHRLEITTARISIVEIGEGEPRIRQVNGDSGPAGV